MVLWLFLTMPSFGEEGVIVVFPDQTHLLYCGGTTLLEADYTLQFS